MEAWAATGAAAERHLLEMLRDRATPTGDDITRASARLRRVDRHRSVSARIGDLDTPRLRPTFIVVTGR